MLSRILVPVKRVVDYSVRIKVRADRKGVDTANVRMSINPFCEIAVEEAVRLKERQLAKEVVTVSIGPMGAQETLRHTMALGADRSIHVVTDLELQPLGVARVLKKLVEIEQPDLILMGKQAIDSDANQTGQLLAGMMKWPQATFASKVEIDAAARTAKVTREVDGGLEVLSMRLPGIITTDLRLNTPRFAKLQAIMAAKKKPIEKKTLEELGIDVTSKLNIIRVDEPPVRQAGIKVKSVEELVEQLQKRGVL